MRFPKRLQPGYEQLKKVYHLFPRLEERQSQHAGTLGRGEQADAAIGGRPRLCLGCFCWTNPHWDLPRIIINEIFKELTQVNQLLEMTILIVEQNAKGRPSCFPTGHMLQTGKIIIEGDSANSSTILKLKKPIWEERKINLCSLVDVTKRGRILFLLELRILPDFCLDQMFCCWRSS